MGRSAYIFPIQSALDFNGDVMPYLSQEDVHHAARTLRDAGLNRMSQGTLWRWLILKERGLRPGATVTFTSDYCREFALRWAVVDASGAGDRTLFQPFNAKWSTWEGEKTKWWLNSFYSQLKREAGPAWSRPEETDVGVWETTGTETSAYIAGLRNTFESRVPLVALAAWRYRTSQLPDGADEKHLAQRLVDELKLAPPELDAVFGHDHPDILPFDTEA